MTILFSGGTKSREAFAPRLLKRTQVSFAYLGHPVLWLFGGHFFGFAFLAHEFEFSLGFFEGGVTSCWTLVVASSVRGRAGCCGSIPCRSG